MRARARALGLEIGDAEAAAVLARFKEMELRGFQLEAADGTVELVLRRTQGGYVSPFQLADVLAVWHTDKDKGMLTKASVQVDVPGDRLHSEATGHGPVDALDHALRGALIPRYPEIDHLRLVDYKVRILDPELATAATTRVLLEATHDGHRWITAGCSDNIIEASCAALLDSFELCVLRTRAIVPSLAKA
jgi:2-isopropylmalate synthase